MKHEIHTCDICGQTINTYRMYKVKTFVFHKEIYGGGEYYEEICKDCWDQLKAMRQANIMAERKDVYVTLHHDDIHFKDEESENAFYDALERKE